MNQAIGNLKLNNMPDIVMCTGEGCPAKESCYRFTTKPSEFMQSYFVKPPYEDGKCTLYWGENAESIWNQLKNIVDPQNK